MISKSILNSKIPLIQISGFGCFLSQNLHKKSFHFRCTQHRNAHFLRFRKEIFHLFKQLWDLVASHAQ